MILKKLVLLGSAIVAIGGCSKHQTTEAGTKTAASSSSTPDTGRVRGVVQTVSTNGLAVRTYNGQTVSVPLDAKTRFAWVIASDLATLNEGDFIGTATTGPDNALRAVELVIFPEVMRGTGEGHYNWDVPGVVAAAGGPACPFVALSTVDPVDWQPAKTNSSDSDAQRKRVNWLIARGSP